jgi:hypothetical protein
VNGAADFVTATLIACDAAKAEKAASKNDILHTQTNGEDP